MSQPQGAVDRFQQRKMAAHGPEASEEDVQGTQYGHRHVAQEMAGSICAAFDQEHGDDLQHD